jgi:hypothetical protein
MTLLTAASFGRGRQHRYIPVRPNKPRQEAILQAAIPADVAVDDLRRDRSPPPTVIHRNIEEHRRFVSWRDERNPSITEAYQRSWRSSTTDVVGPAEASLPRAS